MRSLRWLFITAAAVAGLVVLAIALGSWWLNTFIHSDAFRHEVEIRASQTLGGKVEIQSIDLGLFSGIKLQGLVTELDASRINGRDGLVANIESVNCTYSLRDLLHRRLKLTGVTLDRPEIVLTPQPAQVIPPLPADSATIPGGSEGKAPPFQFILEAAKVKNGSFSIRNGSGVTLTDLQGIDGEMNTAGLYEGKTVTGKIKIAEVTLPPGLHLTDFSSPIIYGPKGSFISAKTMEASAFGGRLAGDYELQSSPGDPPLVAITSVLELNGNGLDVGQISRMANPTASTRLSGSLSLQSKWQGVETGEIKGEGDAQLTNGKLEGVSVLQDLSGVLRVKELQAPKLRKVQTHFQVERGNTRFTGLQVDGGVFQMTGDGTITAQGSLDANLVLILSADAMSRLPGEAAVFFVQRPDGSASIAFHLGGSVDHPQSDLATRLFLQNMKVQNVIGRALSRFFHHREKASAPAVTAPVPELNPSLAPPPEPVPSSAPSSTLPPPSSP